MDANTGALPGGVEPGQRRGRLAVGNDAPHGVVHRGQHRYGRTRGINTEELLCQLIDLRQALAQLLLAEVAQIQVHDLAVRAIDGAPLLFFMPVRLAETIARAEFHRLVTGSGFSRAKPVVLQVAVAILVDEKTALAAAGLGKQEPRARHAGRVILHEFHVAQRNAMPVGHCHAIAGDDPAVGVFPEDATCATGGHDDRLCLDQRKLAACDVDRDHALHAPVIDDQVHAEVFIQTSDRLVLDRSLEECVQHVKTGLIRSEPGPLDFHATEGAHVDMAVRLAAPRASPVLHLHKFIVGVVDEVLDNILLAQPVTARHGIVEVGVEAVVRLRDRGGAALRRHGVAAHRINLRNQRHAQRGIRLGDRDGRT